MAGRSWPFARRLRIWTSSSVRIARGAGAGVWLWRRILVVLGVYSASKFWCGTSKGGSVGRPYSMTTTGSASRRGCGRLCAVGVGVGVAGGRCLVFDRVDVEVVDLPVAGADDVEGEADPGLALAADDRGDVVQEQQRVGRLPAGAAGQRRDLA